MKFIVFLFFFSVSHILLESKKCFFVSIRYVAVCYFFKKHKIDLFLFVFFIVLIGNLCLPCRKSLCLRSCRWNSPETTVTWPRAAILTALRSSQPPWFTMSGRTIPVRTTAPRWPPQEWAWRWLRAGRRPSDRPWCLSPPSPAWPVLLVRAKITVSRRWAWNAANSQPSLKMIFFFFFNELSIKVKKSKQNWEKIIQDLCQHSFKQLHSEGFVFLKIKIKWLG